MSSSIRRVVRDRVPALQAACLVATLALWPRAAAGEKSFTEVGLDFAVAERLTAATGVGLDTELSSTMSLFRLREHRYRGYALEISYAGRDNLELFAVMGRVELGLGRPRFNRRSPGRSARAWVPYLALSAGYGWGAVWDTEYIELYGTEEDVEVDITGVPVYAALGLRRLGVFSIRLEAVGGLFAVTSQDADEPEGEAPSLIPSIGVRIGFGGDSFSYTWM